MNVKKVSEDISLKHSTVGSLRPGDCFAVDRSASMVYMKLDEECSDGRVFCANIESGYMVRREKSGIVIQVEVGAVWDYVRSTSEDE